MVAAMAERTERHPMRLVGPRDVICPCGRWLTERFPSESREPSYIRVRCRGCSKNRYVNVATGEIVDEVPTRLRAILTAN